MNFFEFGHFIETHAVGMVVTMLPLLVLMQIAYHFIASRYGKVPSALTDIVARLAVLTEIAEHLTGIEEHHSATREQWATFIEARTSWAAEPWRLCLRFEDCPAIRGQLTEIKSVNESMKAISTSLGQLTQAIILRQAINGRRDSV
jgi:hypothetical protein